MAFPAAPRQHPVPCTLAEDSHSDSISSNSSVLPGSSAYAGQSQNKGVNGSSQGGGTGWGYVKVTLKSV